MFKKAFFLLFSLLAPMALFAEEAAAAASTGSGLDKMGLALGAGLAIAVAAAGGGIGQGRVGAAALEGIARNPGSADKIFTPMIIGLALIESLVIYALLIAFMLLNKI
ncbi:MAG: F0F1 ATP synthase subunit C [Candidatus Lambdaproteobacteria bacterium RIFOXYD12_FULL_49_8]|uniref:ATP synthase subunit c n=1 Tax=Candidatus Lambdaproteobacteria bacterium RIFOXYD2_FULL_50_16 TaxID=1817772 RepID=A0A1F6GB57_9PROT|nr:MAG: F0F1 ATP synthase subunit C [Candidatus Lambdaproteobacteria bacterium RIFOXYD2_FULL_50_16]OGG97722.1 MAG: F0F1 ATP synthase subunit C [Candidatus Lambdaproteobacteria bacterium RIFOXYD12_FULL_49_8]